MLPFVLLFESDEAMRRLIVDSLSGFAYVVCYSDSALLLEKPPYDFSGAIVSSRTGPPEFADGVALAAHLQELLGVKVLLLASPSTTVPKGMLHIVKGSAAIGFTQKLRAFVQTD